MGCCMKKHFLRMYLYQGKGRREKLPWQSEDPPYLALRRGDSPTVAPAGYLGHQACLTHRLFTWGQAGALSEAVTGIVADT